MLSHIRGKGDRVIEHTCKVCTNKVLAFVVHEGIVPKIKCRNCGNLMDIQPSTTKYIDTLWYKPCKERSDSDPAINKPNGVLSKYTLDHEANTDFLDTCMEYAVNNYNDNPRQYNKYHPIIRLIWEVMTDNKV